MQSISDADRALVGAYEKITLSVYIDGEKLTAGIGSCEYHASCASTEEFSFGNACAAGASLIVYGAYPGLKGRRISVNWSVSDTEYSLLTGRVKSCPVTAGRTTLELWDEMYYGGSDAFAVPSHLLMDCDATEAFQSVANSMGVAPEPETMAMLSGVTIAGGFSDLPDSVSNAAVAGHIAGLLGGNAIITRAGLLAIRRYSPAVVKSFQRVPTSDILTVDEDGNAVINLNSPYVTVDDEGNCEILSDMIVVFADNEGNVTITESTDSPGSQWSAEVYSGGASAEGIDYIITGITFQREREIPGTNSDGTQSVEVQTEEFGAGDGTMLVSNPLADQAAADRVFADLEGLVVRPGSYNFPGGLLLEPGDIITAVSIDGNYSVAAAQISMTLDGGCRTTITCGGASESGGIVGSINQALKDLQVAYAKIQKLVVRNADIVSAKISNLSVEDIHVGKIHSTDYETRTMDHIYPGMDIYPADALYPNNGEEITKGLEIDFTAGIIRGVFFSSVTDALEERIAALEERIGNLMSAT